MVYDFGVDDVWLGVWLIWFGLYCLVCGFVFGCLLCVWFGDCVCLGLRLVVFGGLDVC